MAHPSVDTKFILEQIKASSYCEHVQEFEELICIVKTGTGAIARRLYILDGTSPDVCFAQAINLSHVFRFPDELTDWLIENKSWKEGDYFVKTEKKQI